MIRGDSVSKINQNIFSPKRSHTEAWRRVLSIGLLLITFDAKATAVPLRFTADPSAAVTDEGGCTSLKQLQEPVLANQHFTLTVYGAHVWDHCFLLVY